VEARPGNPECDASRASLYQNMIEIDAGLSSDQPAGGLIVAITQGGVAVDEISFEAKALKSADPRA